MEDEKDNVVTGEILSSSEERNKQNSQQFEEEFYNQFHVRRIKLWHIFLVLAIVLLIIGFAFYIFIKYIEIMLIIIILGFVLSFVKGLIK